MRSPESKAKPCEEEASVAASEEAVLTPSAVTKLSIRASNEQQEDNSARVMAEEEHLYASPFAYHQVGASLRRRLHTVVQQC